MPCTKCFPYVKVVKGIKKPRCGSTAIAVLKRQKPKKIGLPTLRYQINPPADVMHA